MSKLTTYLLHHDLISTGQPGFLQSKSPSTCTIDFLDIVMKAANDEKSVTVVFSDVTKAADRV